jgi:solute carrier family 35 (UDP-sugar transporter), member A1/2/3
MIGFVLTGILAFQFAAQPMLSQMYIHPQISKTSLVLAGECTKAILSICACAFMMSAQEWNSISFKSSIQVALIPACLYSLQNWLVQLAYQHLDSLTFNMLNQSKILFSALCIYWICKRKQSKMQVFALCLLCVAGVVINLESRSSANQRNSFYLGILPVLGASFLSGLCAAVTEIALRNKARNPFFFTLELSVYSSAVLCLSFFSGPEQQNGMFYGWKLYTLIPILTQSAGGIVVGLITKYIGSEMKGFALIFGLLMTALFQSYYGNEPLKWVHYFALSIVTLSMYLHMKYPYKVKNIAKNKSQ